MSTSPKFAKLLTRDMLLRGWHLARRESRSDFIEDLYSTDVFGAEVYANIGELLNRLRMGTYIPSPLLHIDIPKGTLGTRPGSIPIISDRVVLNAIVYLMAPTIDEKYPVGVYSYRLKTPPDRDRLFKENDILDLPYLKSTTIGRLVDLVEPWYALWPEFDALSRTAFERDGYRYLSVSDIAAYFENIQLAI